MKIAFTGSNGFVATKLKTIFSDCVNINRNDTEEQIIEKLVDVDIVINLAGAPIIKRWTPEYKKTLVKSRIEITRKLVKAINKSQIKHFISTSAIGIYPSNTPCNELCKNYEDDFLSRLVQDWEQEANNANVRTTILRFGIVLGSEGGALKEMLLPFKMGLGGIIGNGKMKMSFIDIDDLLSLYKFVIDKEIEGVFNACSPKPVTNYEFTKTLGTVLNRPTILPLPQIVLQALYGEASTVITGSKEIYPRRLEDSGFLFTYPTIKSSLEHILK